MHVIADVMVAALLVIGAAFAFIGSLGLARLGDFYRRLHGPTKATTLGVGSVLIASAIHFSVGLPGVSLHELLVSAFLFLTAPVSGHLLVKAALHWDAQRRGDDRDAAAEQRQLTK